MKTRLLESIVIIALVSCTDHYNDMVKWADEELPVGISVDSAKNLQPDYLTINWGNPDTLWVGGDSAMMKTLFEIGELKGSQDILKMQNQLVFIDGKYSGRETRK